MSIVQLRREIVSNKGILGGLYRNNICLCKTLENPWLDNRARVSCIPPGKYQVVEHNGSKYKDTWILENVPGRSYILFHSGNFVSHTEGCILVGESWAFLESGLNKLELAVNNSRKTLENLRKVLPKEFILDIIYD